MTAAPSPVSRLLMLALWALVLLAGAWLRFWQIDTQLLIDDEWHAIHRLMQAGYAEIMMSMGHADYSIPLTLLFRFFAETIGLDGIMLRLLPMSFGLATIVLIPRLFSPWLDGREQLVLAALIAVSPLLIHFARYVRPYSMTVLLGFAAMILLWRWWQEGGRWRALGFAACAVLAAWLHALTALFTGAALLWLTGAALLRWRTGAGPRDLVRVLVLGGATTLACCALVLPPLLSDPHSIAVKAGRHSITLETLARSWEMMLGVGSPALAALLALPVAAGAWRLGRRAPAFAAYWAWMIIVAIVVIQMIGPDWIHNALVLVRYTSIAQPFVLALLAVGVVDLVQRASEFVSPRKLPALGLTAGLLAVAGLYAAGPLPVIYSGTNQFTNSVRYQLDYDFQRSVYHDLMGPLELPEVYRRMAAEPGDWEIVEAAWHFETHHSPISEYQKRHQIPIRIGMISGLCTDWTWGELQPGSAQRIELDEFLFLEDLLTGPSASDRFVVFRRSSPFAHARELPDIDPCIDAFRKRVGAPWHDSEDIVVFRLEASIPEDAS